MSVQALGQDKTLYIGATDQNLYAITNGAVKWSFPTTEQISTAPTIAPDGTVLVMSMDGNLWAIWGGTPLATNALWPEFHQNSQHTGLTPLPLVLADSCIAPFVFDGTNDGTNFTFNISGVSNTLWNVYSSEDLSNWTQVGTNIMLTLDTTQTSGTNTFEDTNVIGVAQRFYQLSNSNCCSRAIGFVNLSLGSGSNLVADPFDQVDDFALLNSGQLPMNSLAGLFSAYDSWGPDQTETEVLEWTGEDFTNDTFVWHGFPAWVNGGTTTLLPGSCAFIVNTTNTPLPVSFVGLVREQQSFEIQNQTNYLSASAPVAGWITNVTGYVPDDGDIVQLWDAANQEFRSHTNTTSGWTGGTPFLNVAEGFVLITTNHYTWTNSWQSTACAGP